MDATLQYPDQAYGAGDTLALAAVEYASEAITKFNNASIYDQHVMRVPAALGTYAKKITAIANSEAEDLERGVERAGSNQPEGEGRIITLDTKQLIADHHQDEIADFINHVNTQAAYAAEDAQAVAATVDKRLSACISLGARVTARGTGADQFPAGNIVTAAAGGAVTVAYPVSLAGSRALQDKAAEMAQAMDEKNIPRMGRVMFIDPYLHRVLRQDKTLLSADFQSTNDMLTRRLLLVEDFMVEVAVPDLVGYEQLLLDQALAIPSVVEARSTFAIRTVLSRGPVPLDHWR